MAVLPESVIPSPELDIAPSLPSGAINTTFLPDFAAWTAEVTPAEVPP